MSDEPEFEILPIDSLRPHEATDEAVVAAIIFDLRKRGVFVEPIWVDRESRTILNGHHRWKALRAIGARRVPAWLFDYRADASISLDRWSPGPPITKEEVLRAAREGRVFPIKTTRHRLSRNLPDRPIPLIELVDDGLGTKRPATAKTRA